MDVEPDHECRGNGGGLEREDTDVCASDEEEAYREEGVGVDHVVALVHLVVAAGGRCVHVVAGGEM